MTFELFNEGALCIALGIHFLWFFLCWFLYAKLKAKFAYGCIAHILTLVAFIVSYVFYKKIDILSIIVFLVYLTFVVIDIIRRIKGNTNEVAKKTDKS
jgi:hypothetical protein